MKAGKFNIKIFVLLFLLQISPFITSAQNNRDTVYKVNITRSRGTIYKFLNSISDETGLMFIYDSRLFDNDRTVRVPQGEYTIEEAIKAITGDTTLITRIVGEHILIQSPKTEVVYKPAGKKESWDTTSVNGFLVVEGKLKDRITGEPVVFGTISAANYNMGTVSNLEGKFRLKLPDSLSHTTVRFSHLGYVTRDIPLDILQGRDVEILLDYKLVPLQEVVVRVVDPLRTLMETLSRRRENYSTKPVYHTAFYREGVDYRENISLTEAVLKIYKTPYFSGANSEQAKLLKMRKFANIDDSDTLVAKIKSSVHSALLLDVVKNPPDFLSPETFHLYSFTHSDITVIDNRRVLVISFRQKDDLTDPLYKGELYIDAQNFALIKVSFQIDPRHVQKTSNLFIVKQTKKINITPLSVKYSVQYKNHDGIYYVHHTRGDLSFRVRRKNRLFSSNMNVWFEMVNYETVNDNVTQIPRNERLHIRDILFETSYNYDSNFWGNFNTIMPEEEIANLIKRYNFGY